MSLTGLLLGLLDIVVLVLILLLVGAIALWIFSTLVSPIPQNIQRIYLAIVGVIALAMLIALLLGVPRFHIITVTALEPALVALNT